MNSWTDEAEAYVKHSWLVDGHSANQISRDLRAKLGLVLSRNAVIGKVHRSGWKRAQLAKPSASVSRAIRAPRVPRSHVRPPKPGQQNRAAVVHGHKLGTDFGPDLEQSDAKRAAFRKDGLTSVERVESGAGVESPNARPFMEAAGCKWPLGQRGEMWCCNKISRGVYCEGHAAVAFVSYGRRNSNGASYSAPSIIEQQAMWFTRHERVDHYEPTTARKTAKPVRSLWDEGREAA